VLNQIKNNDPSIETINFWFGYEYNQHTRSKKTYATTVDWDKEQCCFVDNSHLTCVEISIRIKDHSKKSRNATTKDRDNIRFFARALARNRSIREIHFDVNDWLNRDESIIGDMFKILSPMFGRIHKFRIINTILDDSSVQKLKMAIESCGKSELKEINIVDNSITNEQSVIIIDAINGHCNKLKTIEWDSGEGLFGTSQAFLSLANLVSNPSSVLEILDFGRYYSEGWEDDMTGSDGTIAFATALANNSTLKVINVGLCPKVFIPSEWQIAFSILRQNSIEELHLRQQQIGVEGMNSIVQGLSSNTSLKILDLRYCEGITSNGWIELSNAIKSNHALPLERLLISASVMNDDDVATSIVSILDGNNFIYELFLDGVWDVRDEVLIELSNALANNNTLTDLDIGYINRVFERRIIDDKSAGIKALSRILCDQSSIDATFRSNHTLTRVYLRVESEILLEDFDGLPTLWRPTTIQDHYPSRLTNMLQLNRNDNKFEVSRQKTLLCSL